MLIDIELTAHEIDVSQCIKQVQSNSAGAVNTFIGTTRDWHNGKPVRTLSYQAYDKLALKSLQAIVEESLKLWQDITAVLVKHRTGECPVGSVSVIICVAAVHRGDAIKATEYVIDELKKRTAIWKKELYSDGSADEWQRNCSC